MKQKIRKFQIFTKKIANKDRGFEDLFAKIDEGLHGESSSPANQQTSFFSDEFRFQTITKGYNGTRKPRDSPKWQTLHNLA